MKFNKKSLLTWYQNIKNTKSIENKPFPAGDDGPGLYENQTIINTFFCRTGRINIKLTICNLNFIGSGSVI